MKGQSYKGVILCDLLGQVSLYTFFFRELLVTQATLVSQDLRDTKAPREKLVPMDGLVLMDIQDPRDPKESKEHVETE